LLEERNQLDLRFARLRTGDYGSMHMPFEAMISWVLVAIVGLSVGLIVKRFAQVRMCVE
jgi:hypothetical protein